MASAAMSAYEIARMERMAANHAHLVALGIENDTAALRKASSQRAPVKGSAINKKAKREVVPPRSRSLRLQNLDTDGKQLPDKPDVPPPEPAQTKAVRKPSVPLEASKVSTGATTANDAATFIARLCKTMASSASTAKVKSPATKSKTKVNADNARPSVLDFRSVHVAEGNIAKLVPERIFSMDINPSDKTLLVAAGDTWGRVGLWDVLAPADEAPVATFEPHSRPVAGVRFLPNHPHQLLSCAHDGAVRLLDLGTCTSSSFVELYRSAEDEDGDYPSLHGFSRSAGEGGAIAVCRGDGVSVLLDPRAPAPAFVARLHEKKIFSVDFSPSQPWLLASASLDRTVAIWDIRKVVENAKKPRALTVLDHGLSVTAARFSTSGSRLLTTCNDNLLRVFTGGAGEKWELRSSVKHNNHTGRYITPFQAEWVRGSDDEFLCGSLEHPRGVDVFNVDRGPQKRLDEEDCITSVVSLLAQHPTRDVLVASNASGKCFVWA